MFQIFSFKSGVAAGQVDGINNIIPGWISGDAAGIAASGTGTVLFDLGSNWMHYQLVQVSLSVLTTGTVNVTSIKSSDDTTINTADPALAIANATAFGTATVTGVAAGSSSAVYVRPMGRYLAVSLSNTDGVNPVGAGSFVQIAVYP